MSHQDRANTICITHDCSRNLELSPNHMENVLKVFFPLFVIRPGMTDLTIGASHDSICCKKCKLMFDAHN